MVIPANIRFEFYKTRDDVKLENKFSAIPLVVPLTPEMKSSYKQVSVVTSQLKNSAQMVYSSYALTALTNRILPRRIIRSGMDTASKKFSLAFSNTPGPVKKLFYYDTQGKKAHSKWSKTFVVVSGYVGMCISCMSFVDSFQVSITADDYVLNSQKTSRLCKLIEQTLVDEIDRLKDFPEPVSVEKKKND